MFSKPVEHPLFEAYANGETRFSPRTNLFRALSWWHMNGLRWAKDGYHCSVKELDFWCKCISLLPKHVQDELEKPGNDTHEYSIKWILDEYRKYSA